MSYVVNFMSIVYEVIYVVWYVYMIRVDGMI